MNVGAIVQSYLGFFTTLGQTAEEADADLAAYSINRSRLMRSVREQERAAVATEAEGARQAGLMRTRGSMLEGSQRVAIAANNLEATGSAGDLMASSSIISELDASNTYNNALAAAMGHRLTARSYGEEMQQQELQLRGRQRERTARVVGSFFNAGGSVLSAAASMGGGA